MENHVFTCYYILKTNRPWQPWMSHDRRHIQFFFMRKLTWNVKITIFQHMPCRYLPDTLIDWHPIWPPQPAAVDHPAAPLLNLWRREGVPILSTSEPWTLELKDAQAQGRSSSGGCPLRTRVSPVCWYACQFPTRGVCQIHRTRILGRMALSCGPRLTTIAAFACCCKRRARSQTSPPLWPSFPQTCLAPKTPSH